MRAIELRQLLEAIGLHLRFGGRDDGVGMRAKENAAQTLARQKRRRGALDAQAFDHLAALALELLLGKRGLLRQFGDQLQQFRGEFGEAVEGDGAGVRAGAGAQVGAHAPQIFFDLPAGARFGAGANDGRGDFREARRFRGDRGVAAAEIEFAGEFGNGVRFDQDDFEAIGQLAAGARRPDDRALGTERGNLHKRIRRRSDGHHAAPFLDGWRNTMARRLGSRYFCATARTCSGVTSRKPSRMEFTSVGSSSKSVKQAR